jgi:Holliday junction resolvase
MSNYSRGANFERRVQRYLEKQDWFVIRSAGSHSIIDLVALSGGEVKLIQCKIDGVLSSAEREQLHELARDTKCQVYLFMRGEGSIIGEEIKEEV